MRLGCTNSTRYQRVDIGAIQSATALYRAIAIALANSRAHSSSSLIASFDLESIFDRFFDKKGQYQASACLEKNCFSVN